MRLQAICFTLLLATLSTLRVAAVDPAGNGVLYILGKDKNSREFQSFKETWGLDRKYESSLRGIKLFVNEGNARVDGIMFAGENCKLNDSRFSKYTSALPFGIALTDDLAALGGKLGESQLLSQKNVFKFNHQNVGIEVSYASTGNLVITSIKYYNEPTKSIAAKTNDIKNQPVLMASIGKVAPSIATKMPNATDVDRSSAERSSILKKAIMEVFKAYKESAFYSVKDKSRGEKNFFNYKYTYSSKLKIPGEKFNMLYSFPFATSNLDFISILKESETLDKSFESTYKDFEKQLMETFPSKDGWVASCIPNKESKSMSDLQFTNSRYGAVVLDYCKNPKGKHLLYMRFLLFSN